MRRCAGGLIDLAMVRASVILGRQQQLLCHAVRDSRWSAALDHDGDASSFGNLTRLYATAAKVKAHPTRSVPRTIGRRMPPIAIHGNKSIVDEPPDRAKRMILPQAPLHVDIAEQRPRSLVRPAQIDLQIAGSESEDAGSTSSHARVGYRMSVVPSWGCLALGSSIDPETGS